MRQPDDESPSQQIIVREVLKEPNGGFAKLKDAVFLAVILAVGAIIWSMNNRLTKIETLMTVIASKNGIDAR